MASTSFFFKGKIITYNASLLVLFNLIFLETFSNNPLPNISDSDNENQMDQV